MEQWLPVLIIFGLAAAVAVGLSTASQWLGLKRPNADKLRPYECGVPPVGDANERHSVRFYLIGMLFILFDVEIIFLYPWAAVYRSLKLFGLIEMLIFIAILVLGYIYAWKKGALDWQ
ncbi:MAG TPA: NADH-quinone oxidoreductase subunit A [Armatimonadota bacterium]|nr:NADH-quinone oxidoreductase subunit A [Armatimonadota bacterium]